MGRTSKENKSFKRMAGNRGAGGKETDTTGVIIPVELFMSRCRIIVVTGTLLIMLPKTAEYALRTVALLASSPDRSASADFLAEKTKVPRRYLHKVLQDLVKAKLVGSKSGPGGGYSLLMHVDEVSILDVINAVAPLERIRHCPLGLPSHTTLCPVHKELDLAYQRTEEAFSKVTIGQLLRSATNVIPLCDTSCEKTMNLGWNPSMNQQ